MICVDSDFIIDFLKGRSSAVEAAEAHRVELVTTEINRFEVLFGILSKIGSGVEEGQITAARDFFDAMEVLPFDAGCGAEAARLLSELGSKGKMINQNDGLIAAIMSRNRCTRILTRNLKDYSRIRNIAVVEY
jgi:predicted nucleic acid-binding protein